MADHLLRRDHAAWTLPASSSDALQPDPHAFLRAKLTDAVSNGDISARSLLGTAVLPVMCLPILEAIEGDTARSALTSLRALGLAPEPRHPAEDVNRLWQTGELQRVIALGAAASEEGGVDGVLRRLADDVVRHDFTGDLKTRLDRWAEIVSDPSALLRNVHAALRADRDEEANDLLRNARLLSPVMPELAFKAEVAAKHVALRLRDRADERRLSCFVPKRNELEAVGALLQSRDEEWALNLVGPGGIGKTMLARYLTLNYLPERGVTCARVDFDYLDPDYPEKNPVLLILQFVAEIARSFETSDQDVKAGFFLVDRAHEARLDPSAPALDRLAGQFADFVGELGAKRIVLLLDTCEELSRPGIGSRPRAAVSHTFGLLKALHGKLPSLRVIFLGRRALLADTPEDSPPVVALRGFTREEAEQFLTGSLEHAMDPATMDRVIEDISRQAKDKTCIPFDLNLMAEWFDADPQAFQRSANQGGLKSKYVETRIIARLRTPNARHLLAVATALGTFNASMLLQLSDVNELELDVFLSQEWICAQGQVFCIDPALGQRLGLYFDASPGTKVPGLSIAALSWLCDHACDRDTPIALFASVPHLLRGDDLSWSSTRDRAAWQIERWRILAASLERDPTRAYEIMTIILGGTKSTYEHLPAGLVTQMAEACANWAPASLPAAGKSELWQTVEQYAESPSDKILALAQQIVFGERDSGAIDRFLCAFEQLPALILCDVTSALDSLVEAEVSAPRLADALAAVAVRSRGLCAEWARGAAARVWLSRGSADEAARSFQGIEITQSELHDMDRLPAGIRAAASPQLRVWLENALVASFCDAPLCQRYVRCIAQASWPDDHDGDRAQTILWLLSPAPQLTPRSNRLSAPFREPRTRRLHWQLPPAECVRLELEGSLDELVSELQRLRSGPTSRDSQATARELLGSLGRMAIREGNPPSAQVASELELLRNAEDPEAFRLAAAWEALLHERCSPLAIPCQDTQDANASWRQLEAIWSTTAEDGFMGGELTKWLLAITQLAPPARNELAAAERCLVLLESLLVDPMHEAAHAAVVEREVRHSLQAARHIALRPIACLDDLVRGQRLALRLRMAPPSAVLSALSSALRAAMSSACSWDRSWLVSGTLRIERELRQMKFPERIDGEIVLGKSAPYLTVHVDDGGDRFEQIGTYRRRASATQLGASSIASRKEATMTVTGAEYAEGYESGAGYQLELRSGTEQSRVTLSVGYDDETVARIVPELRAFADRFGVTPQTRVKIFLDAAAAGVSWEWMIGAHRAVRCNLSGGSAWHVPGNERGWLQRPSSSWQSAFRRHRVLVLQGDIARHRDGLYRAQWSVEPIDPRIISEGPELVLIKPSGAPRDARSGTERLQLANARSFAAQLHSRGLPQVCVLPSVPERLNVLLDGWVTDTVDEFEGQPLDEQLTALRAALASHTENGSSELVCEACLYRSF